MDGSEATSVTSFGYGKHGQLGIGNTASTFAPTTISSLEGRMISQVSCGGAFSAGLSAFGLVYTWGDLRGSTPILESHLRGEHVKKIACSAMETFALTKFGKVLHWGEVPPKSGEQDLMKKAVLSTPCLLGGEVSKVVIADISAGALHALLLSADGRVYSVGENHHGQLGLLLVDKKSRAFQPQLVVALESIKITQIACGGTHSIALAQDGRLYAWGSNKHGQLGLPLKTPETQFPVEIPWAQSLPKIFSVACGDYHNLALCENGSLYSWGNGRQGQLGTGATESTPDPQLISGFDSPVVKVAAGGGLRNSHSLALTKNRTFYGWGSAGSGQLGGQPSDRLAPTPIHLPGSKPVTDFACGWTHSLVLTGSLPTHLLDLELSCGLGSFDSLPNDMIKLIIRLLNPRDIVALSNCSHFFNHMTAEPTLWLTLFTANFPEALIGNSDSINWKEKFKNHVQRGKKPLTSLTQLQQHKANPDTPEPEPQGFFSTISNYFATPEPYRTLIAGLDAAGKTTILYQLKKGEYVWTMPTCGLNVENIPWKGAEFTCWDIGGPDKIRPLWVHYFHGAKTLIWVVDSSDTDRMDEVRHELWVILRHPAFPSDCVLLVLANKQDLPRALPLSDIRDRLRLKLITSRPWHIQASNAASGEGLREGLDWAVNALKPK